MLGDTIKTLRTQRGLTQEELAIRLHVVRQTVSKWEKGLSTPDAEMLQHLAEELETTVQALLGGKIQEEANRDEVAQQLARLNEHLAVRNRRTGRIIKALCIGMAVFLVLILGLTAANISLYSFRTDPATTQSSSSAVPLPEKLRIADLKLEKLSDGTTACSVTPEASGSDWNCEFLLTDGVKETLIAARKDGGILTANLGTLIPYVPYTLTLRVSQGRNTGLYVLAADLIQDADGSSSWTNNWGE